MKDDYATNFLLPHLYIYPEKVERMYFLNLRVKGLTINTICVQVTSAPRKSIFSIENGWRVTHRSHLGTLFRLFCNFRVEIS